MPPSNRDRIATREEDLGLGAYLTGELPGTLGHLKVQPEDFVVEEVPLHFPRPQSDGKYTVAAVRARNWETNRLIREIADRLGVSKRGIFFAGTKDKRAVTTQYVSVRAPLEAVTALGIRDVEILDAFRVDRAPKIGELVGNRFVVRVRRFPTSLDEAETRARAVLDRLRDAGGFPNYFGVQRFGVVRPITHVVGRLITKRDLAGAVWTYVANPIDGEPPEVANARARLERERDPRAALSYYPGYLTFERQMLHHLAENPDDWAGALRALPHNLAMMFVYAHQSHLFNCIVTERLRRGIGLNDPQDGDYVVGLASDGTPDRSRYIPVSADNQAKVRRQCLKGKALVTGVIYGTDVPLAGGPQGEIERAAIEAAGVTRDDFLIPDYPEIGSTGTRREMLAPLGPVTLERGSDDAGEYLELRFFLNKGTYATSLLREVMKARTAAYA